MHIAGAAGDHAAFFLDGVSGKSLCNGLVHRAGRPVTKKVDAEKLMVDGVEMEPNSKKYDWSYSDPYPLRAQKQLYRFRIFP
jgi:hypothetical protein